MEINITKNNFVYFSSNLDDEDPYRHPISHLSNRVVQTARKSTTTRYTMNKNESD